MTTLYGIKNCDTVKKARRWLQDHNINYTFVDFRADDGLNEEQLEVWFNHIGTDTLINKRSTSWKALTDVQKELFSDTSSLPDQIALIMSTPTLIKRPLLETKQLRHVGFNEKTYGDIFNT